ncbi:conserved hypothetical protein [Verticillium alfalfae VaMs.102]|uniref:Uncharacterized protein n=1 Tax=Verticillium alfalfae (strain VaMs.102 / ATCC MYA-4576 / FGSC 10136) TaxID=526221 RepID=C9SLN2_VERA1|nr:conserved hypothetical protein [Verticillium alfalfae VaMs.102]EEY19600.1 conserved hypothetical protein [Verticillium alfalfae VaMs.102]
MAPPTTSANARHVSSPGNPFAAQEAAVPPMRMPHLEFVYRIVANMDQTKVSEIRNIDGAGLIRLILPIKDGVIDGPRIKGVIVEDSGADWAEIPNPDKIFTRLNARYTIKTHDGFHILVTATGIFRPGPGVEMSKPAPDASQDDVEYFTQIRLEAPGDSPYNWLNGIVPVGVMTMSKGRPIIDCYRLTNFPGVTAENL